MYSMSWKRREAVTEKRKKPRNYYLRSTCPTPPYIFPHTTLCSGIFPLYNSSPAIHETSQGVKFWNTQSLRQTFLHLGHLVTSGNKWIQNLRPITAWSNICYLQTQLNPVLGLPPTKPAPHQATLLNQQQPNQVRVLPWGTFADQQRKHGKNSEFKIEIYIQSHGWTRKKDFLLGTTTTKKDQHIFWKFWAEKAKHFHSFSFCLIIIWLSNQQ